LWNFGFSEGDPTKVTWSSKMKLPWQCEHSPFSLMNSCWPRRSDELSVALPRRTRSYFEVPGMMLRWNADMERMMFTQPIGLFALRNTRGNRLAYQRLPLTLRRIFPLFLSFTPISTGLVPKSGTAIWLSSDLSAGLAQVRVE